MKRICEVKQMVKTEVVIILFLFQRTIRILMVNRIRKKKERERERSIRQKAQSNNDTTSNDCTVLS